MSKGFSQGRVIVVNGPPTVCPQPPPQNNFPCPPNCFPPVTPPEQISSQVFTPGTSVLEFPPGATSFVYYLVGGGGAGADSYPDSSTEEPESGGGGGGGGYQTGQVTINSAYTYTITVAEGVDSGDGENSFISCYQTGPPGIVLGTATGGKEGIDYNGGQGGSGITAGTDGEDGTDDKGGDGGSANNGVRAAGGIPGSPSGQNGVIPGQGGGGAYAAEEATGGSGAPGAGKIVYYL